MSGDLDNRISDKAILTALVSSYCLARKIRCYSQNMPGNRRPVHGTYDDIPVCR